MTAWPACPTSTASSRPRQVADSAASIAAMQEPCGAVPWTVGEHIDIWNHVEAAMAMLVGGEVEAAERAYDWVPTMQHADGSWPMKIVGGEVEDDRGEVNMSAYLAVGVWHHWLVRRDLRFVRRLLADGARRARLGGLAAAAVRRHPLDTPTEDVRAADRLLEHLPVAARRRRARRAARRPAAGVGAGRRPARPRRARAPRPASRTSRRTRWTGTTRSSAAPSAGRAAYELLESRWDDFVVPGLGIRCVDTNPWVTGAETCELAMALDAIGDHRRALRAARRHAAPARGRRPLLDRLGLRRRRAEDEPRDVLLAGRAHDLHRRRGDPGRRRARRGRRPQHRRLRHHARHLAGPALRRARPRVRLPVSASGSPASPAVRRSTRIEPSASTSSKLPLSSARRKTWYGGCPPSAGSGKTSWITSAPPGITHGAQPV